jgi:threonylcarbamoyladenosine tRNA methylthiotransferase MtaB
MNIGIDVIAGFPGETDICFDNTYGLLELLPAAYLHVFPYSRRPGTPAAEMSGQVPAPKIRERTTALRQLSDRKKQTFYQHYIGSVMEVLVESRRDRASGLLKGITRNYIPVLFDGDDGSMGTLQKVLLESVDGSSVRGSLM